MGIGATKLLPQDNAWTDWWVGGWVRSRVLFFLSVIQCMCVCVQRFQTCVPAKVCVFWVAYVTCPGRSWCGERPDPARRRVVALCKRQFSASKSCKRDRAANSKRLSVTPCPGSGSFARCFPSFSPYCRTSSVGGGRSAVSRFRPEPLNPDPGRSAGPGFLARRMGSKPCVCSRVHVSLCLSGFSGFSCVFGSQLAQTQSVVTTSSADLALYDGFQSQFQQRK